MTVLTPPINRMAQFVANMPPSVTRGSRPGVFKSVNQFLHSNALLILEALRPPKTFQVQLDIWTKKLCSDAHASWGTGRKSLNIFIRDATYNVYLRDHFGLARIEEVLELPLDSFTTKNLRKAAKHAHLHAPPPWRSIRCLKPEDSLKYQELAVQIARSKNTYRCHLDIWYWRVSLDPEPKGG